MRLVVVLLFASGCSYFSSGSGIGPNSETQPLPNEQIEHLNVTLISRCAKPARVCYSGDKCITLVRGKPKHLHAPTRGTGEVFVNLEGSTTNVSADMTFTTVELDESCTHLGRKLAQN
jgi:hypothetical protein